MKYTLNMSNYCTFEVFRVNKLPARSYFIPYSTKEAADRVTLKEKRYASDKVICLNGVWDFKFYPRPAELPQVFDTDEVSFDQLDVPSCWQFRGYDKPFYTNIRYQFPFHPPVIPTVDKVGKVFTWMGCDQGVGPRYKDPGEEYNFVGVYRRKLDISDTDKRYIISFMGVASCMDLYLNGSFIGYSEGAHNTAEFDLTGKLVQGENEIVVAVHRWCNGTYLEDQDMFRNNGIFRDVLLRVSDDTDLADIDALTEKTGDTYRLTMSAEVYQDTEVTFTIEGTLSTGEKISKSVTTASENKKAKAVFENLEVTEWNADEPVLYTMYYETPNSCVKEIIGFKNIEIRKDIFYVNGRAIKFHGVNHHDTSPVNGYYLTPDEIEKDLQICKDFNIDTVRTSHYPPDPLLLELADQMGIYIVDENDLETHGTWSHQIPPTYNTISHDTKWKAHYLDRITHLYQRDKIHRNTSIIMWSLGNEAGGYNNTDAMYDYLKEHTSIPVHYESAIHCKRIAYDVGSEMYPSVKMVHDVGNHCRKQKQLNDRPYFMCEYAHAMGVGPGNTESYWKEIYQYDNLMGGCVWEMVDHAILHEDGSYTYGGDHGEWSHDKNFCVDGMFYPDRTPSVGAKIIRFIYRPIRVTYLGKGEYEIFNTSGFAPGNRYQLTFTWNDGTTFMVIPEAAPLTRQKITLERGKVKNGNLSVIVTTTDTKTGKVVSEEQLLLKTTCQSEPETANTVSNLCIGEKEAMCQAQVTDGKLFIVNDTRNLLTTAPVSTILYRAATDNDTDPFFRNTMAPYLVQTEKIVSSQKTDKGYQVVSKVSNKKASFTVTDDYQQAVLANGEQAILVTSKIHCDKGGGILPRFGKTFRLDPVFDQVTYHGRTGESYCDMKDQFPIGTVECHVSDMTEPNIKPQESGNRCDCSFASVSDGTHHITFEAVDKFFELGIKPYTDLELASMKHRKDEKTTGTYVTIQAFQQGIGTGACGPAIMPPYQYSASKDYELKFLIRYSK